VQVTIHDNRSIVSLIANVGRSSEVLSIVFAVLEEEGIQVRWGALQALCGYVCLV
jgi:hypothetical protein